MKLQFICFVILLNCNVFVSAMDIEQAERKNKLFSAIRSGDEQEVKRLVQTSISHNDDISFEYNYLRSKISVEEKKLLKKTFQSMEMHFPMDVKNSYHPLSIALVRRSHNEQYVASQHARKKFKKDLILFGFGASAVIVGCGIILYNIK